MIKCPDGQFMAYLARPTGSVKTGGVVVAQEIFGVNAAMRTVCDRLAAQNLVALCPDLFWRQERNVNLTDRTQAEWDKAFKLFQGFNLEQGVADLAVSIAHLRADDGCNGLVGGVGYCLGGLLAYLVASRTNVDCAVGYYGVNIDAMLAEAKRIQNPLMLHVAEEDHFVSKEAQAKIRDGLKSNASVTIHSYPGVDHAFARPEGQKFDRAAADLADRRTLTSFKQHLS
ncbi:MAG: dienelactone hydrolase family protein [Alphaproteobacteria bacterium]|nr:dienelactone hydrolase family protein [Alphaproteobacteria bacterium]